MGSDQTRRRRADVVGWGPETKISTLPPTDRSLSLVLGEALHALGVRWAFGLVGGGVAPLAAALSQGPISVRHFRHEAGAAFAATEAYFATGEPAIVFTTTGPGLTNALTGLVAARWDGAKLILLSGGTSPSQRGRGAVQETSDYTFPGAGLFTRGAYFDYAVSLADPSEVPEVLRRIALGLAAPGGFVAHVSVPLSLQAALIHEPHVTPARVVPPACPPDVLDQVAARLHGGRCAIWVGFGARHAAKPLREIAERTGAGVICSPRAKGVFPEDHPLFHGVTGTGAQESVEHYFQRAHPEHVLVLGTRLGEVTSFWSRATCPATSFIHVDLSPVDACAAFPEVSVLGITADVGSFLEGLLARVEPRSNEVVRGTSVMPPSLDEHVGRIRPQFVMQVVQRRVIDTSDAPVMTESGDSFSWGNCLLRFRAPGRYRTSAAWGSMGHFTTGVVGAALARQGKAVAIVGDGAALMNNEMSTAVRYGARAVWIVMNDAQYGLNRHGLEALGLPLVDTDIPRVDFTAFARSMGAAAVTVKCEAELDDAMELAMRAPGPFVLDVHIDPDIAPPIIERRVASLKAQSSRGAQ